MSAPVAYPPDTLVIHPADGAREGWVCADCGDDETLAEYEVGTAESRRPVCRWHKDEAIHDSIPYGFNCPGCGTRHSPLWNDGSPLDT